MNDTPVAASDPDRFIRAVERIDAANAQDPNRTSFAGSEYPAELIYSMRMSEWLGRLAPEASEALRLAVRCQHLRRWAIPRGSYPMTRAGYHQWRTTLGRFHADEAGQILRDVGYDEPTISRTQSLILAKTWRKMSDRGHQAALDLAKELPQAERELIVRALHE